MLRSKISLTLKIVLVGAVFSSCKNNLDKISRSDRSSSDNFNALSSSSRNSTEAIDDTTRIGVGSTHGVVTEQLPPCPTNNPNGAVSTTLENIHNPNLNPADVVSAGPNIEGQYNPCGGMSQFAGNLSDSIKFYDEKLFDRIRTSFPGFDPKVFIDNLGKTEYIGGPPVRALEELLKLGESVGASTGKLGKNGVANSLTRAVQTCAGKLADATISAAELMEAISISSKLAETEKALAALGQPLAGVNAELNAFLSSSGVATAKAVRAKRIADLGKLAEAKAISQSNLVKELGEAYRVEEQTIITLMAEYPNVKRYYDNGIKLLDRLNSLKDRLFNNINPSSLAECRNKADLVGEASKNVFDLIKP